MAQSARDRFCELIDAAPLAAEAPLDLKGSPI